MSDLVSVRINGMSVEEVLRHERISKAFEYAIKHTASVLVISSEKEEIYIKSINQLLDWHKSSGDC